MFDVGWMDVLVNYCLLLNQLLNQLLNSVKIYFEKADIKINFIRERKRYAIAANLCTYIWAYLSLQRDI